MAKMNPEIKAKWVAALRSGEYKQATDFLKTSDGKFCCLGVLCDLHSKETAAVQWSGNRYQDMNYSLPNLVADWAGTEWGAGPEVAIQGNKEPLAIHNDSGATFAQIADAIEAQL